MPGTGQGGQYKFCKSDELNQIVSLIFIVIKMKKEMHFIQEIIEVLFQASYELLYSQYLSGEGGPEAGARSRGNLRSRREAHHPDGAPRWRWRALLFPHGTRWRPAEGALYLAAGHHHRPARA